VISFTSTLLVEIETDVVLLVPKVAVSDGPLGTVTGVQLLAVCQSLLVGLSVQVALPAKTEVAVRTKNVDRRRGRYARMDESTQVAS
jgi:hypothetical protein